jgi:hypothetical protein
VGKGEERAVTARGRAQQLNHTRGHAMHGASSAYASTAHAAS